MVLILSSRTNLHLAITHLNNCYRICN